MYLLLSYKYVSSFFKLDSLGFYQKIKIVHFLFDNIYVLFGNNVYRQFVCIVTTCAPLISNLLLYCYELQYRPKSVNTNLNFIKLINSTSITFVPGDSFRWIIKTSLSKQPKFKQRNLLKINQILIVTVLFLNLDILVIHEEIFTNNYIKKGRFLSLLWIFLYLSRDVPLVPVMEFIYPNSFAMSVCVMTF